MIWRLTCNGSGDTARLDIQQGEATPIMEIEGTGNPFTLRVLMVIKKIKHLIF